MQKKLIDVIMNEYWGTWLAFVANDVPYEHGPIQMLTYHHKLLSIFEASEQAVSTWLTTMPHVRTATALRSLALSYPKSIGSFSSTKGVHTHLQV